MLSTVINSLCSALEYAKPIVGVDAVKAYKAAHSTLLSGQDVRNITIHERHVGIDHYGYIPPSGNTVNFDFRKTPRLVQEERSASTGVVLNVGANYHIEYQGKLTDLTDLCFQQFYEVRAFLVSRGVVTQQGAEADSPDSGAPAI